MTEPRYGRDPNVLSQEQDGELLLVPTRDHVLDLEDAFYVLNDPVSLRIWQLLAGDPTAADLQASILSEFDAAPEVIMSDVERFLTELVRVGAARVVR